MRRHLAYLRAVCRHKWFVFLACLQMGVPLWSAILHDWDKFLPDEWLPYARTFYKPNGEKQYVESVDFARAWMKHQHRNKHHWQYWLGITIVDHNFGMALKEGNYLVWDRGQAQEIVKRNSAGTEWYELRDVPSYYPIDAAPMPDRDRREMIADWMGAGRAYMKGWTPAEPLKWYEKNKDNMILHPETRAWVEATLRKIKSDWDMAWRRTSGAVLNPSEDE